MNAPNPTVPQPQRPQIPLEYQRAFELVNELWNDGDIGAAIRKKSKEKYNIQTQDDAVEPIVAPLKKQLDELTKTLAEEREARAKAEAEAKEKSAAKNLSDILDTARKSYNLTQEGFEKMVARMKETGNFTDADAAAAWVMSKEPPPASTNERTWGPTRLNPIGALQDEDMKLLHKDPEAYQDRQLNEFIRDPDKFVRETLGQAA